MGKFSKRNISDKLIKHIEVSAAEYQFIDYDNIYVDNVGGSDTNDGLTPTRAIKTLAELSKRICNKTIIPYEFTINLVDSTYNEDLVLNNIKGEVIVIKGASANTIISPMLQYNKNGIYISNIDAKLVMKQCTIKPRATDDSARKDGFTMYVSNCLQFTLDNGVVIDTVNLNGLNTYTVVIDYTSCIVRSEFINMTNLGTIIQIGFNSNGVIDGAYFDKESHVNVISGGRAQINSVNASGRTVYLKDNQGLNYEGMDIDKINRGIVLESGGNINGRYIKYADGTLICYAGKENSSPWYVNPDQIYQFIFPHGFLYVDTISTSAVNSLGHGVAIASVKDLHAYGFTALAVEMTKSELVLASSSIIVRYIAIGRWK